MRMLSKQSVDDVNMGERLQDLRICNSVLMGKDLTGTSHNSRYRTT